QRVGRVSNIKTGVEVHKDFQSQPIPGQEPGPCLESHGSFSTAGDVLRLRDVVTRTGYNKGMCFRLLYTLHQCGFLDKVGENHYRLASEVRRRRLYRIGYAAQGQDTSFDREVRTGLSQAAEREHIELIVVDNRYQPKIALRSADYLIKEQVDLVIEFQTDEGIAPASASR